MLAPTSTRRRWLPSAASERASKLNENEVLIYHFRDGKVSEVWIQSTDQHAADEFFS